MTDNEKKIRKKSTSNLEHQPEDEPRGKNNLSLAIFSFLAPLAFSFSVFIGLLLGALPWCYFSSLIWFYGVCLSFSTLKNHSTSNSAKKIARMGLIFSVISGVLFLSLCSFTESYGPYKGHIIDKESGEPISGAVIVMDVSVSTPNVAGGSSSQYFEAEAITDLSGEFNIPSHRLFKANLLTGWSKEDITIFKPGYSCYLSNSSDPLFASNGLLSFKKKGLITLTKLNAENNECEDNWFFDHDIIDQLYVVSRYYDQKMLNCGFEPNQLKNYYRVKHNLTFERNQKTIYDFPHIKTAIKIFKRNYIPPDEKAKIEEKIKKEIAERRRPFFEKHQLWMKERKKNPEARFHFKDSEKVKIGPARWNFLNYETYGEPAYFVYVSIPELYDELIFLLKNQKIDFLVNRRHLNEIIILGDENKKTIDEIIDRVCLKPHMLFLSEEKKDMFISLLKQENIPFLLRTARNAIGYDVIWDYGYNDLVEKQKLIFFNQVINGRGQKKM